MSCTTVFMLDDDFCIHQHEEIHNGLVMPSFWEDLWERYAPPHELVLNPHFMVFNEEKQDKIFNLLNEGLEERGVFYDKVIYKLTFQNIFKTSDIEHITTALTSFGLSSKREAVTKRCFELIESLKKIDIKKYPYFIIKLTSVDDNVVGWFITRDCEDETHWVSLRFCKEEVCDFVDIDWETEQLTIINNLDFFKED